MIRYRTRISTRRTGQDAGPYNLFLFLAPGEQHNLDLKKIRPGKASAQKFFYLINNQQCVIKKKLLEAAQLASVDLDAIRIAVVSDIFLVNLVFPGNGKCLRAGDALLNPFCFECLRNLV
jgi:hypothetical protein